MNKALSGKVPFVSLGSFSIAKLPAGEYLVGPAISYLADGSSLGGFVLLDGQKKQVDLDLSLCRDSDVGYLNAIAIDENGIPRTDATLRLEGPLASFMPIQPADIGELFVAPPGRYSLLAQLAGYEPTRRLVVLKPCQLLDPIPQGVLIRVGR
jgi:hypothetical protein